MAFCLKIIIVLLAAVALVGRCLLIYDSGHLPRNPNYHTGQIYEISLRGGGVVYGTEQDIQIGFIITCALIICLICFAIIIVLKLMHNRPSPKGKNGH